MDLLILGSRNLCIEMLDDIMLTNCCNAPASHLKVPLHGAEEAHVLRGLHVVKPQLSYGLVQILHGDQVGLARHFQDLLHHRQLKLFTQSTQYSRTLTPELHLRQGTRGLGISTEIRPKQKANMAEEKIN